ncbi:MULTISPECIES: dihydrofolate reductase [unclassified Thioalkalivibrio]|uniref:dihydrofolate reductase n=1 Tax=unclassified Thioalkalivibrio TaxID=2621013 RepID=UPI00035FBE2C|nr:MULTISPECIES: dihydrofolate reductase [unclassified Thioalkalivibrio]
MPQPEIHLMVALDPDHVIGRDNDLPWRLPKDLQHFKRVTDGHPMIMGRRTFESIGRPLPGRRNLVLTRQPDWQAEGVEVYRDLDAALATIDAGPAFVIGGAGLFEEALPRADVLHLTRVHECHAGDTFFPALDPADWDVVWYEHHEADDRHACPFTFERLERRR